MTRFMLTACAAGLVTAAACPASAADHPDTQTGTVRISDLNLATEHGAKVLLRRAGVTFADLCAQTDSSLNRNRARAERQCVTDAMSNMVAKLNAPMVSTEFARQSAHSVVLATAR